MKKLIILLLILSNSYAYAQFSKNLFPAIGISTVKILGDNPGALPILQTDTTKEAITGGSFDGAQPGVDFRLTYTLDDDKTFRIPFGMDYSFYEANERIPASQFVTIKLTHSLETASIYTGFHAVFLRFPLADAKAYAGLEARGTLIHNAKYRYREVYATDGTANKDITIESKKDAWRFGGLMRIGIEGEINKSLQINTSAAFAILNLLGRDNKRGELLTPFATFESEESIVYNFHFSLLIQYKF